MKIKKWFFGLLSLAAGIMTISMILFPQQILDAARQGLFLWANNVFPSLFPFYVINQLLIGLGIVNFIGTLFEPIMRPLLNVPGEGALCFSLGISSGYPMGAKLISSLRSINSCTKDEAERLMSFCNSAGPLFIIGVVGIGIFNNPAIGYLLVLCNYAGLLSTGLLFRIHGTIEHKNIIRLNNNNLFKRAIQNMKAAQKKDGRNFNYLFSDSVKDGINLMLTIGGYIIIFSVIVRLINITGLTTSLSNVINIISKGLISKEIAIGIINGIFEMTIGCNTLKELSISLYQKTILAGLIISWGGLSTHAQIQNVIEHTDISYMSYFCAKIAHSILTATYVYFIYPLIIKPSATEAISFNNSWLSNVEFSLAIIIIVIAVIVSMAIINSLAFRGPY